MNHLYMCAICQVEIEALAKRRKTEIDTFIKVGDGSPRSRVWQLGWWLPDVERAALSSGLQLNKEFQAEEAPTVILCISMQWFREWESFVKGKDNGRKPYRHHLFYICKNLYGNVFLKLCKCRRCRTSWSHRQQQNWRDERRASAAQAR